MQSFKIVRLYILFVSAFFLLPSFSGSVTGRFQGQAQAQLYSDFANFDRRPARRYRRARRQPYYVAKPKSRRRAAARRAKRRAARLERRRARAAKRQQAAARRAGVRRNKRLSKKKRKNRVKVTRLKNKLVSPRQITTSAERTAKKKSAKFKKKKVRALRDLGRIKKDPVQVVISIPGQSLQVFRGTKVIASSRISSGKVGHRTPTGVFSIIQKRRRHYSNLYNGAPMPNMQRITWSGIALHAGRLPGYPASHGCIRLPHSFSRSLFGKTRMGAHVVVQNGRSRPRGISHPMLFQPLPESMFVAAKTEKKPSNSNWSSLAKTVALVSTDRAEQRVAVNSELFQLSSAKIEDQKRITKKEALFNNISKSRSEAPLRIFITKRTEKERIREIQKMLIEFGYDIGQANGYFGKKTTSALFMVQDEENMDVVNGRITEEVEAYLRDITGYHLKGNGHLYIRQNFRDIYDAPIQISESSKLLGTHIFTAQNFENDADEVRWVGLTVKDRAKGTSKRVRVKRKGRRGRRGRGYRYITKRTPAKAMNSASEALNRLSIAPEIRTYISRMLTPGTSLMVSHHGYSNETGKGTDFVVKVR